MKVVEINNPAYPRLLKHINKPPKKLYYKGFWDTKLFDKCLAVVGSRQMTSYGRRMTDQLVSRVAATGITIVSGFMYGVDAQAHKAALSVGGKTVAVMPCGIDLIHPGHQKNLYEEIIARGGLILSKWEGDFSPAHWTYPKRNRIVAGLSQATLVIEAARKSGSLITARLAKIFGRKLFAVPGPLTSPVSEGTLQLIRGGVEMVTNPNDILAHYGLKQSEPKAVSSSPLNLNKLEHKILEKLVQEPREIDTLSRLVGIPASTLGATLSLMLLRGVINEEEGKYYVNSLK